MRDRMAPPGAARVVTRRQFLGVVGAAGAAAVVTPLVRGQTAAPTAGATRPPNFVIIFCDDLGYGDLGCYGHTQIKTPNLDRMATQGTRFTDFYCAAPVCTPSRAALLTGCYPPRVGLNNVLFPQSKVGLNAGEITIAELLQTRGYATACIGKWHLGHLPPFLPTRHGFDYYFGLPYSNDMQNKQRGDPPLPLMRNEEIVESPVKQETLTERYTEEAVKFIAQNKDKPFFVYLAHNMPHIPLHVSEKWKGKSARGLYGDVVECLDWSVGQVLQAIKDAGVEEHTLVVFTSDNGPWLIQKQNGGSAGPLRNGKGTTYDGGMREPCIMRWPGQVPAGRTCAMVAATIDLYPTFARLAGAELPRDRVIDGQDVWPIIAGQPNAKPRGPFFYYSGGKLQAVRDGKWKYRNTKQPGQEEELFDLEADIGEQKNLAREQPDQAKRLRELMASFDAQLKTNVRPCGSVATQPAKA